MTGQNESRARLRPLCCPHSKAAVSVSWVHSACARASELYSCLMGELNPSNFLGVTQWNPHPGDIHPCPEVSSGDHTQCCHPLCWKLLRESKAGWISWLMQDGTFLMSLPDAGHSHTPLPPCLSSNTKQNSGLLNNDLYQDSRDAPKCPVIHEDREVVGEPKSCWCCWQ